MCGGVESHFGDPPRPGIGLGSVRVLGPGPFSFLHTVIISPVTVQKLDHGTFVGMRQGCELASHSSWAGLR